MKKKLFNIVATLALVFITAFSFVACGSKSKIKITLDEFNDEFIAQVVIMGIPSGTSTSEDFDTNITRQSGVLYSTQNYYEGISTTDVAEFDQGKWDTCVEITLDKPKGDDGMTRADLMEAKLDVSNLKVAVNGQEIELIDSDSDYGKLLAQFYGYYPGTDRYYAIIENISADTQIKFVGNVQAV